MTTYTVSAALVIKAESERDAEMQARDLLATAIQTGDLMGAFVAGPAHETSAGDVALALANIVIEAAQ